MTRLDRLHWALLGVIVVLVVWLTTWDYHRINEYSLIRVNRITGTTERFQSGGWKAIP